MRLRAGVSFPGRLQQRIGDAVRDERAAVLWLGS